MINKINKLSETEFTQVFGNIFENASWIAKKLYDQKPFKNFDDLSEKMLSIFEDTSFENKLKILNSHPDLANKAKVDSLTEDSNKEQKKAGLDSCTQKEFDDFNRLNTEYKKNFGFPFILAVKEKNKLEILDIFKKRVLSKKSLEFNEATKQVKNIAHLRLIELKIKIS